MTAMLDPMRKTLQASFVILSPAKARALAKAMMEGQGREQISKTAQDLMEWSARNKDRLSGIVRDEVRSQLRQMGVASRDEVEALRKRVRELEKTRRSPAKRSTTRKTPRRSTVKQPGTPADATATATEVPIGSEPVHVVGGPSPSDPMPPSSAATGVTPTG
jgi:polyhydroxyalkanoate synthesis regulator phasin